MGMSQDMPKWMPGQWGDNTVPTPESMPLPTSHRTSHRDLNLGFNQLSHENLQNVKLFPLLYQIFIGNAGLFKFFFSFHLLFMLFSCFIQLQWNLSTTKLFDWLFIFLHIITRYSFFLLEFPSMFHCYSVTCSPNAFLLGSSSYILYLKSTPATPN